MIAGLAVGIGFLFLLGLWTVAGLLSLAATAFWIWMIADCIIHEPSVGNDKLVWVIVIICLPLIGSLLYFFLRRPHRPVTAERYGK